MPPNDLDRILFESTAEVLESMFYTSPVAESAPCSFSGPCTFARLSFNGNPSGRFSIRTPVETGRRIAAAFLAADEADITETQAGEVMCELANMLCGSVLSRLEKNSRFELSKPELEPPEANWPENAAVCSAFTLDEGPLAAWLELGPVA